MENKAQKLVDAFNERYENLGPFDDDWQELCIAQTLRELIKQCSTSTSPDPNMDEFYARMYGSSDSVIYVDDIENIITEIEK